MLMQVAAHRYKIRDEFVNFSFQLVRVSHASSYESGLRTKKNSKCKKRIVSRIIHHHPLLYLATVCILMCSLSKDITYIPFPRTGSITPFTPSPAGETRKRAASTMCSMLTH